MQFRFVAVFKNASNEYRNVRGNEYSFSREYCFYFPTEAEYSYFSANHVRLKISLIIFLGYSV